MDGGAKEEVRGDDSEVNVDGLSAHRVMGH